MNATKTGIPNLVTHAGHQASHERTTTKHDCRLLLSLASGAGTDRPSQSRVSADQDIPPSYLRQQPRLSVWMTLYFLPVALRMLDTNMMGQIQV